MKSSQTTPMQLEERFEDWSGKVSNYIQAFFTLEKNGTPEETEVITLDIVRVLNEVFELAINQNRLKDNWQPAMFLPYLDGLEIFKQSVRTGTEYKLGIDVKGFYFQLSPNHIANLKHMDDEFWVYFLQLSKYGTFDFVVHERVGKVESVREKNNLDVKRSKVFSLLKNYLLFELYAKETYPFGSIRLGWAFPYYWEDLLDNLKAVAKICYRLDYLLWKITYQKSMDKQKQKSK
jgi:hypothetical protein